MAKIRKGEVVEFLRRNYFKVVLDDGQEITAVMPEAMLEHVTTAGFPVKVEMRKRPRMHRIVGLGKGILGPGRPAHRLGGLR